MREVLVTKYIEAGFTHLKEITEWPQTLLPGVPAITTQLSDRGMRELMGPLDSASMIHASLAGAPEPAQVPSAVWREAIENWTNLPQALPVTLALLRATEKIESLNRKRQVKIDSAKVGRSLAVLACAIFMPEGGKIFGRMAAILGGSVSEPVALIGLYVQALESDARETLGHLEKAVLEDPTWARWSERFVTMGESLTYVPKIIGISPIASQELVQLLAAMFKEELNADHGGNHSAGKNQDCPAPAQQ